MSKHEIYLLDGTTINAVGEAFAMDGGLLRIVIKGEKRSVTVQLAQIVSWVEEEEGSEDGN